MATPTPEQLAESLYPDYDARGGIREAATAGARAAYAVLDAIFAKAEADAKGANDEQYIAFWELLGDLQEAIAETTKGF